ncbi:MAG TPA: hypothetical protein V6C84_29860 [Coleofasciculaceae cyanobacterium]|jgi:hypothetical protein
MLTNNRLTTSLESTANLKNKSFAALNFPVEVRPEIQSVRLKRASESKARASERPTTKVVPSGRLFTYRISASGTTYSGNTSFPSSNTSYTPAANFRLPGALVIEPRLGAQNTNRRNGLNAREITFIIGNDASLITAGTLRYSTHTWGHRHWGGRTAGRPAIDTAFVSANNRTNILSGSVDPQWSRNDTSNLFSWKSSLTSAPKQILSGNFRIRFTNGGRNISGSITFFGNGFIEPGAYAYTASFTGSLFR